MSFFFLNFKFLLITTSSKLNNTSQLKSIEFYNIHMFIFLVDIGKKFHLQHKVIIQLK